MKKEIHVRRREPKKTHLPARVVADARRRLGSVFVNQAPLCGLEREEELKYLPRIIGVSEKDIEFEKKIRSFWAEFRVDVPSDGLLLNIGMNENDEPLVIMDWIKYRWLILHPFVAESKEKAVHKKEFYIHDPVVEVKRTNNRLQVTKKAYIEFIKMSDDPEKMARMVRVLGKRNPAGMNKEMQENFLAQLIDDNPVDFYRIARNKNLDTQDEILHMVDAGVLQQIGTAYLYLDTEIGATMEEAIHFMGNARNSQALAEMRAKLKELTRAKTSKRPPRRKKAEQKTVEV